MSVSVLEAEASSLRVFCLSEDAQWLAGWRADGQIRVWSLANRKELSSIAGPADGVRSMSFSPSGNQVVVVLEDGNMSLFVWRGVPVGTGKCNPFLVVVYFAHGPHFL
jgi:WD40 repeat protein